MEYNKIMLGDNEIYRKKMETNSGAKTMIYLGSNSNTDNKYATAELNYDGALTVPYNTPIVFDPLDKCVVESDDSVAVTNFVLVGTSMHFGDENTKFPNSESYTIHLTPKDNDEIMVNSCEEWFGGPNKIVECSHFDVSIPMRPNKVKSMFENFRYIGPLQETEMSYRRENLDMSWLNMRFTLDFSYMFKNAQGIDLQSVAAWEPEYVNNMEGMFDGFDAYQTYNGYDPIELDFSHWNVSECTNFENAFTFFFNKYVEKLILKGWKLSGLTEFDATCSMFNETIPTIDISGWDLSSIEIGTYNGYGVIPNPFNIGSRTVVADDIIFNENINSLSSFFAPKNLSFSGALTDLSMRNWHLPNLKYIDYMFMNQARLETIDMSGLFIGGDSSNVVTTNMFYKCTSLKTIYMRGCDFNTVGIVESGINSSGLGGQVTIVTD